MKIALLCCLALLCLVGPALADVVTVQNGWTVVYHIDQERSGRRYAPGTYWIAFPASATYGVVYLESVTGAQFLGFLDQVVLPEGFPTITYECPAVSTAPGVGLETDGCLPLDIMVTPPAPTLTFYAPPGLQPPPPSCGTRKPVGKNSLIVVGGLPDDADIIGPFATPALAQTFATRYCHGDYSIEPVRR